FEPHAISDVLQDEQVIRSISELEILGCDQNFACFVRGGADGGGQVAHGVASREFLADKSRSGFIGPKCRATCEHGLARCTDEFEKTYVCIQASLFLRALNRH